MYYSTRLFFSMTYEATILQQLPLLQAELAKVRSPKILRDPLVHRGQFKGKILGQFGAYPAW